MTKIEGVHEFYHPDPVGTPEAVREAGFDLKGVGSCSEYGGSVGKSLGCQFYEACPFKFRDKGPKNVAMRLVKVNGTLKEKEVPCFRWMRQYHYNAMAGRINAEVYGDETKRSCVIAVTGSEARYPGDPKKAKARKKIAKEIPIPKFPSIVEAYPEQVQSARVVDRISARRAGQKIFSDTEPT